MQDIIKSEKSYNEIWLIALITHERKHLIHSFLIRNMFPIQYS
jgi:hypothetical protein